ncbi:MAG: DUF58 domain-containing protein [Actinobacteria bacterium]|nr:DUF58 domain-containing protein [Actinomycetota bacterium]
MTRRGRLALVFGVAVYLAAWAFGSHALYPLALGLVIAVLAAWAWMRLAARPLRLSRRTRGRGHFEGEDVDVTVEVELSAGLPPAGAVLYERVSKLGERATRLRPRRSRLSARYVLEHLPRGRYELESARAVLEDPFGLARTEVDLRAASTILVYPRLIELDHVFSDAGSSLPEGRRLLMHRPSGFDLHSVRDHQQGESLRRVHWRSTAKRARLMVKELEDAPRDEVAVLLDAQSGTAWGESFDVQVRAAGSLLFAHTSRNRRAVLVVNGNSQQTVQVSASEGDRRRALELLAAAEPDGARPAESVLADEMSAVLRALELVVVTARLTPRLVDRLVQRGHARRQVSLVYVEAATFAGGAPRREPSLLRLQAAGVPVATVRYGDDLAAALGGRALAEVSDA